MSMSASRRSRVSFRPMGTREHQVGDAAADAEGPARRQPNAPASQPRITYRARRPRPALPPTDFLGTPEQRFAAQVRRLRIDRGWSQAELAARLQSTLPAWAQTTVAKTESASRPIRLNEVAALATVLGVALHELIDAPQNVAILQAQAKVESLLHEEAILLARKRDLIRTVDRLEHDIEEIDERGDAFYKELQDAVDELNAVANTQRPGT